MFPQSNVSACPVLAEGLVKLQALRIHLSREFFLRFRYSYGALPQSFAGNRTLVLRLKGHSDIFKPTISFGVDENDKWFWCMSRDFPPNKVREVAENFMAYKYGITLNRQVTKRLKFF